MTEEFKKKIIKAFFIEHYNLDEISEKFNTPWEAVSEIIYEDTSNGFKLLSAVKEEIYGQT